MRKYLIGFIVGVVLMLGTSVFAEEVKDVTKNLIGRVIQGQFDVTVDGTKLTNPVIVIDGTSFAPVREFGESIGYEVLFDTEGGVILNKKEFEVTQSKMNTLSIVESDIQEAISIFAETNFVGPSEGAALDMFEKTLQYPDLSIRERVEKYYEILKQKSDSSPQVIAEKIRIKRNLLQQAKDRLTSNEAKMKESREFFESNKKPDDPTTYESRSIYTSYTELINTDKAEIIRLTAEIEELEAQLQPQ